MRAWLCHQGFPVVLVCALALGGASLSSALDVEVTLANPDSLKFIKGDTGTFECEITNGGNNDYWVWWEFCDGTGDLHDGKNLTQVDHYMPNAGSHLVKVFVYDNAAGEDDDLVAWTESEFWVLWVQLELVATGQCPSVDNDKRDEYKMRTRPVPGSYDLGLREFHSGRHGWGLAVHGTPTPAQWFEPVYLRQSGQGCTYNGTNGDQVDQVLSGEDNPPDELLDHLPPHVYLMDYPGVNRNNAQGPNDVLRIRCNFTNQAESWDRDCSDELNWWTAQSWAKNADEWIPVPDASVNPAPGDNSCAQGHLDKLTWNMY